MQTQATPASGKGTPKVPDIKTLFNSAVWFRLNDGTMTNEAIARHLGVDNFDRDFAGRPGAVFYSDHYIAGIRVNENEIATFHVFQAIRERMKQIADPVNVQARDALSQVVKPDWTIDPKSHHTNSSPEFDQLCKEVERLIRDSAHSLINGQVGSVAGLIMAQLAHVHGMAPQSSKILGFKESEDDGVLHGTFEWNGRVYRLTAVPMSS